MQINLQTPHINIAEKTREMVLNKLARLEKQYDRIEQCHIILKKAKSNRQENFIAEVKLAVPGNDLFAREQGESWRSVIDKIVADLTKEIKKRKAKINQVPAQAKDVIMASTDWDSEDDSNAKDEMR